jgi:hypothetical protein
LYIIYKRFGSLIIFIPYLTHNLFKLFSANYHKLNVVGFAFDGGSTLGGVEKSYLAKTITGG